MKLIESNWVKHHSSGIIAICFNLIHKGVYLHRYDDTLYKASIYDEDEQGIEREVETEEYRIESFKKEEVRYIVTEQREKDQMIYYYIPYGLLDIPKRK